MSDDPMFVMPIIEPDPDSKFEVTWKQLEEWRAQNDRFSALRERERRIIPLIRYAIACMEWFTFGKTGIGGPPMNINEARAILKELEGE